MKEDEEYVSGILEGQARSIRDGQYKLVNWEVTCDPVGTEPRHYKVTIEVILPPLLR